jgi:hypothetical protein
LLPLAGEPLLPLAGAPLLPLAGAPLLPLAGAPLLLLPLDPVLLFPHAPLLLPLLLLPEVEPLPPPSPVMPQPCCWFGLPLLHPGYVHPSGPPASFPPQAAASTARATKGSTAPVGESLYHHLSRAGRRNHRNIGPKTRANCMVQYRIARPGHTAREQRT